MRSAASLFDSVDGRPEDAVTTIGDWVTWAVLHVGSAFSAVALALRQAVPSQGVTADRPPPQQPDSGLVPLIGFISSSLTLFAIQWHGGAPYQVRILGAAMALGLAYAWFTTEENNIVLQAPWVPVALETKSLPLFVWAGLALSELVHWRLMVQGQKPVQGLQGRQRVEGEKVAGRM